jgi:hypothetical protein
LAAAVPGGCPVSRPPALAASLCDRYLTIKTEVGTLHEADQVRAPLPHGFEDWVIITEAAGAAPERFSRRRDVGHSAK